MAAKQDPASSWLHNRSNKRARTSSSGTTSLPIKSEKHHNETGDLEIVTSDDILCKVKSFYLQAASQVFRDMINQGTRSRIHLTDLELETEENLGTLFDLMTGGTVKTDPLTEIPKLYLVKRLAQKYECDVILRRISLQSRTDMYEGKCRTLVTFMVGIFMNDIEVCKAALREAGGWWKVGDWPKQMISGPLMNPSALPPDLYAMIKPKTMWAWTSAYRNVFHLTYENEKELEDHHTGLSSEQRQRRDKYSWQFVFAMFSLAEHPYSLS